VRLSDEYLRLHANLVLAYVKVAQLGCSDFSKEDALAYAGRTADLVYDENLEEFPDIFTIDNDNEHLIHAVKDLQLKYELYSPIESGL